MILFSDLHLEQSSADVALAVLRAIGHHAKARGDRHIAFLGDFWMVRHTLPVRLLLQARDEISAWRPYVDRVDVLPGNHDQIDLGGRHALEVFDGLEGIVRVHSQPEWTDDGFWLPYRASHEEIRAVLAEAALSRDDRPGVLFAHMGVLGAMMNNLKRDDAGFPAQELLDAGFRQVLLGHYHRHASVMKGVRYVGSPYQVTYAEAGQDKGLLVWRGLDEATERILLDIGPAHHKVVIDADHPESVELPTMRPNDKLWVVVKGQMAGAARKVVEDTLKGAGVEAARIEIDVQDHTEAARITVNPADSMSDLAARYVAAQDIPEDYKAMLLTTFNATVSS